MFLFFMFLITFITHMVENRNRHKKYFDMLLATAVLAIQFVLYCVYKYIENIKKS